MFHMFGLLFTVLGTMGALVIALDDPRSAPAIVMYVLVVLLWLSYWRVVRLGRTGR